MCNEELMRPRTMFDDSEDTPVSLNRKSSDIINKFLGEELRAVETYGAAWYYGPLLAWTLKCIITSPGWKIVSIYGHSYIKPAYQDVQTDYTKFESCVIDGQILVEKDDIRMVITVKTCRGGTNFVQIEAREKHQGLVKHSLTPSQIS